MARGRPPKSEIRQNLVEVLHVLKRAYGYELYKAYLEVFPKVSMRVVYYHLKMGCKLGLFRVERVLIEPGEYSWGPDAEKVYYVVGWKALPQKQRRVRDALRGFLAERKASGASGISVPQR